jgi:hypothetical protein
MKPKKDPYALTRFRMHLAGHLCDYCHDVWIRKGEWCYYQLYDRPVEDATSGRCTNAYWYFCEACHDHGKLAELGNSP